MDLVVSGTTEDGQEYMNSHTCYCLEFLLVCFEFRYYSHVLNEQSLKYETLNEANAMTFE